MPTRFVVPKLLSTHEFAPALFSSLASHWPLALPRFLESSFPLHPAPPPLSEKPLPSLATATFRIWRSNGQGGKLTDYSTDVSDGMVVLDDVTLFFDCGGPKFLGYVSP